MVISVVERGGRVHSAAADKAEVRRRGVDVSVVFGGASGVLATLALSSDEACLLIAALRAAFGAQGPSSTETDG